MATPIEIDYKENHVEFRLSNKPEHLCKIDVDDFKNLVEDTTCWYAHSTSGTSKGVYIRRWCNHAWKTFHLHREIVGNGEYSPDNQVDHINRDSLDNRRENLRVVGTSENCRNRGSRAGIVYRDICITHVKSRGSYQAYKGSKYYGSAKTIEGVREKIDQKLSLEE